MPFPALGAALLLSTAPVAAPELVPIFELAAVSAPIPADGQPVLPAPLLQTTIPVPPDGAAQTPPATETPPSVAEHEDIVVTSRARNVPGDPLQDFNFASFKVTQAIDQAVVRPAALAYSRIVPEPIRLGVRNFLNHLTEPVVFVNFLLQHRIGKAFETFGRFVINSTLGALGIFDIAKRRPFVLPYRPNGFADTMGFYGVKTGAFLYLPIIGPTTVRDLIGIGLDRLLVPLALGKPFNSPAFIIPTTVFGQLDQRDQFDEKMEALSNDPSGYYTATREDYLKDRQARIDALHSKRVKPRVTIPPPPVR